MAVTDVREVFAKVADVFNPNAAEGLNAVFQFEITGDQGGSWQVTIRDKTCRAEAGNHADPTVKLTMSSETWLGIVNRELGGMQAFMSGKLKVSGDIMLAQRIPDLFAL
jgi:putative sterol carrier protein